MHHLPAFFHSKALVFNMLSEFHRRSIRADRTAVKADLLAVRDGLDAYVGAAIRPLRQRPTRGIAKPDHTDAKNLKDEIERIRDEIIAKPDRLKQVIRGFTYLKTNIKCTRL